MQNKDCQKLRECPFCGGENIAVGSDKGTVYRHNTAFGDLTRSVPTVRWAYCVDCGCVAPAEKVNNFDGFYKPDEQEDALNRAISAWNRRAQPANEPLTLDELREMDGEPVYIYYTEPDLEFHEQENGWMLIEEFGVNCDGKKIVCFSNSDFYNYLENYGKTWLAYRYKPLKGGE